MHINDDDKNGIKQQATWNEPEDERNQEKEEDCEEDCG